MQDIQITGLSQNNLKHISLHIPKEKITVFTGVSGSGKSSIVFDTIAAESQRQMNETYPPFVRSRMPKHLKPEAESIKNLTPSVIVDQSPLGGNARSTVGTISGLYAVLRLLYSRAATPSAGSASHYSFNDPAGMCPVCSGLGRTTEIDLERLVDKDKSWNEGCIRDKSFEKGKYFWRQLRDSGFFDPDKPVKDFTPAEMNRMLYGADTPDGERLNKKIEGVAGKLKRFVLNRDTSGFSKGIREWASSIIKEGPCPACHGRRLNEEALASKLLGYCIDELCAMELSELLPISREIEKLPGIAAPAASFSNGIRRLIDIGLPYLSLDRQTETLSGGEGQRLKIVRYMGSSLSGMTYIFDEPSAGLHPRDVYRMNDLLRELRDAGNTVLVVEHDPDVILSADHIIDIGPEAGEGGGRIQYEGDTAGLLASNTKTGEGLRARIPVNPSPRHFTETLPVRDACLHNLNHADADFPLGVMTVVTGVAGSGKSSLVTGVFAPQYADRVTLVDQGPITATNRSTPASFLGFFDEIRTLFAKQTGAEKGLFSFNSDGACPHCGGKGVVVTELAFMDPVTETCEACGGSRYSTESLSHKLADKNILEVLALTAEQAADFFKDYHVPKTKKMLAAMQDTGLSYLHLGQPLSTLSGGERQRLKLADRLGKTRKKATQDIFIFDEPTTGLHPSDITKLLTLFNGMVEAGNTVIIIEHNTDVMRAADYIIDIGPDGGTGGGHVVFTGTPQEMMAHAETVTAQYLRK